MAAKSLNSQLITVKDAAELLSCSTRTVKRKIKVGDLIGKRDGLRIVIPRWSLDAYINNMPAVGGGK